MARDRLDGCFEGAQPWDLDWHLTAWGEELERLKDLYVFGSARLCDSLMRRGLFDEYRICLAPIVLGKGAPLFKPGAERRRLELLESRPLATGGVILRYGPWR